MVRVPVRSSWRSPVMTGPRHPWQRGHAIGASSPCTGRNTVAHSHPDSVGDQPKQRFVGLNECLGKGVRLSLFGLYLFQSRVQPYGSHLDS